jgi:hypothetical protein
MTKQKSNIAEKYVEIASNILPILTVVFFASYYYFTTKFADLQKFNDLANKVVIVERDISLLQKEDITAQAKLHIVDELEKRVRDCEKKLNLLITEQGRVIPSETTLELKAEITVLKHLIKDLTDEIKSNKKTTP